MNELIQKPWFFTVSIVTVLLCSLWTWSALHGGKPFVSWMQNWSQWWEMRWEREFGSGMQKNIEDGLQRGSSTGAQIGVENRMPRASGSGMQRNFSWEKRMWSGSLWSGMQGRPRPMSDDSIDGDYPTPPPRDQQ